MNNSGSLKTSLLAAASLSVAMFASHAIAMGQDVSNAPTVGAVEQSVIAPDRTDPPAADISANKWVLGAAAAGVLAAIIKLIGFGNFMNGLKKVGPAVTKAASSAATASVRVVKSVGSSLSSPLRFTLLMAGIGAFAFTGVAIFDLEWTGGLVVGAVLTASAWWASAKLRRALTLRPVRVKRDNPQPNRPSERGEI